MASSKNRLQFKTAKAIQVLWVIFAHRGGSRSTQSNPNQHFQVFILKYQSHMSPCQLEHGYLAGWGLKFRNDVRVWVRVDSYTVLTEKWVLSRTRPKKEKKKKREAAMKKIMGIITAIPLRNKSAVLKYLGFLRADQQGFSLSPLTCCPRYSNISCSVSTTVI